MPQAVTRPPEALRVTAVLVLLAEKRAQAVASQPAALDQQVAPRVSAVRAPEVRA